MCSLTLDDSIYIFLPTYLPPWSKHTLQTRQTLPGNSRFCHWSTTHHHRRFIYLITSAHVHTSARSGPTQPPHHTLTNALTQTTQLITTRQVLTETASSNSTYCYNLHIKRTIPIMQVPSSRWRANLWQNHSQLAHVYLYWKDIRAR